MRCDEDDHYGPILPTGDMAEPIDGGFVLYVRCEECKRVGQAVIDFEADVVWEDEMEASE